MRLHILQVASTFPDVVNLSALSGRRPTKLRYTTHFLNTSFGILDLKVVPESDLTTSFTGQGASDRELFAAATSAGFISLFTVHYRPPAIIQDEIQYWESLSYFCSLWVDDANEIITQICWSSTQDGKVAFTTASGAVKVLQLPQPNKTTLPETGSGAWTRLSIDSDGVWTYDLRSHVQEVHVHSLEAWACAITSPSTIVSGGDDACLAWNSIPNKSVIDTSSSVPIVDRRIHQAGVTAVLPVHRDSDDPQWPQPLFLITGSYDDHIRILTVPNAETGQLRPRVLAEANLGGGVWRLKLLSLRVPGTINGEEKPDGTVDWVKYDRYEVELAVCCMYAGARIVRLTGPTLDAPWNVETIAKFTVHQSMCYGLDVLPGGWLEPNKGKEGYVFLSCSFYDKQLCVWKWVPKPK